MLGCLPTSTWITVHDAGPGRQRARRSACLESIVVEPSRRMPVEMILDRHGPIERADREQLTGLRWRVGDDRLITLERKRLEDEPLLWVDDTLGWCLRRGGRFRTLAHAAVNATFDL
ncbi:MAG TPA: hypothetical protein VGE77_14340 [Nocardioides sp.]